MSRLIRRRRTDRGFTLLEILLALIVLMVGLVGIMALFPVGIKSTKESTEDTMAAMVAESVYQSIVRGMRAPISVSAAPDGSSSTITFRLFHDGLPNGTLDVIVQDPKDGKWGPVSYPSAVDVFKLGSNNGGADKIKASIDNINTGVVGAERMDPSDPYRQYSFQFDVRRVPGPTPTDPGPPLFEYRIRVYRNFGSNVPAGVGTGSPVDYFIKEFCGQVAAN